MALYFRVGNFAFQIDHEISHAKFRVLREFLAHQQYTLWTVAGGDTGEVRDRSAKAQCGAVAVVGALCHASARSAPTPRRASEAIHVSFAERDSEYATMLRFRCLSCNRQSGMLRMRPPKKGGDV